MIHLRLLVPVDKAGLVWAHLVESPGVAHVVRVRDADAHPGGELLLCDVAREAANEVVEWLQDHGVHRDGAITVDVPDTVVSDAAEAATAAAPGAAADALIWEEVEARSREESALSASYLVFIAIAGIIAGVGILLDSPILIVGAMVVGPEYGPLAALCVALVRWRVGAAAAAGATLVVGIVASAVATLAATVLFRATDLAPEGYDLGDRELTAFISHPDGLAAVVAVLAGVVGMLALTQGRSGALIGVLVSVTTIPAAANVGVATAYGEWAEVGGAALQLLVNVVGLVVAGLVTLLVQSRATAGGRAG